MLLAAIGIAGAQTKPRSMPKAEKAAAKPAPHPLAITFTTTPTPPKTGSNQFEVTVQDASGKPIADAEVFVLFVMPAMPEMKMPEMRKETKLKAVGDGSYTGAAEVMMSGTWNVTVAVRRMGKEIGSKRLSVTAK